MAKRKCSAKMKRCIIKVSRKGTGNPYAICKARLG